MEDQRSWPSRNHIEEDGAPTGSAWEWRRGGNVTQADEEPAKDTLCAFRRGVAGGP